jgi:dTDP-4-amino-4,6-dideoxygalactose transaminase
MTIKNYQPFCGQAGLNVKSVLGHSETNSFFNWFAGSQIYYTYKARTAISYVCKLLGLNNDSEILVPSYNCGSEIDPIHKSGTHLIVYRIDKNCVIDLDDAQLKVNKKTKALYVIHYFGFPQPLEELKLFCERNRLYLLEDCALSLFSCSGNLKLGTIGDVSFFSFPKTLPVPDGGALIINNSTLLHLTWKLTPPKYSNIITHLLLLMKSGILEWSPHITHLYSFLRTIYKKSIIQDKVNDNLFPDIPKDYYFDTDMENKAMSIITQHLLDRFNFESIIMQRCDNYKTYLMFFNSPCSNIKPIYPVLPKGVCPLYFPIIVPERDRVCATLNDMLIGAIPWWSGYHKGLSWEKYPDACYLKNNLIALPIHQNLDEGNIIYIAETLLNILN